MRSRVFIIGTALLVFGALGCSKSSKHNPTANGPSSPNAQELLRDKTFDGLWLTKCEYIGPGGDDYVRESRQEGFIFKGIESFHIEVSFISDDCSTGARLTVDDKFNGTNISINSYSTFEKRTVTNGQWITVKIEAAQNELNSLNIKYLEYVKFEDDSETELSSSEVSRIPVLELIKVGDGRADLPL